MYICIHGKLNRHESNRCDQMNIQIIVLGLFAAVTEHAQCGSNLIHQTCPTFKLRERNKRLTKETLFCFFPKMKPEATF